MDVSRHRADYAGDSGAATIVFIGHAYGGFNSEVLDELVTVHLSDGDQDIAGELTVSPADQALVWTASEPIEADRPYTLTFSNEASDYEPARTKALTVEWPEAAIGVGQVNLRDPSPRSYVTDVLGDCRPDGPVNSCGGCERIVERTETHWSVEAAVEIGRNHNQFILGRVALGTDEASAEDKLETARFRLLAVEDAAYLRANGGKLADWAAARGCLAVEVIKADGTPIIADSKCLICPAPTTATLTVSALIWRPMSSRSEGVTQWRAALLIQVHGSPQWLCSSASSGVVAEVYQN